MREACLVYFTLYYEKCQTSIDDVCLFKCFYVQNVSTQHKSLNAQKNNLLSLTLSERSNVIIQRIEAIRCLKMYIYCFPHNNRDSIYLFSDKTNEIFEIYDNQVLNIALVLWIVRKISK